MSSVPAIPTGGLPPEIIERFDAILRWVNASQTVDQACNVATKAEQVAKWLDVIKASSEARIAASRLECIAIRRVASLGGVQRLRASDRVAGKAFAALSDDEFESIIGQVTEIGRPSVVYRNLRWLQEQKIRQEETGRRTKRLIRDGFPDDVIPSPDAGRGRISRAAAVILQSLVGAGDAFKVSDAAEELADRLAEENDEPIWRDDEIRPALEHAVREALRNGHNTEDGGPDRDRPEVITYFDDALGWVRIPWAAATLAQLGAMAELRMKQAAELAATAKELGQLFEDLLEQAGDDLSAKCADAEQRALRKSA